MARRELVGGWSQGLQGKLRELSKILWRMPAGMCLRLGLCVVCVRVCVCVWRMPSGVCLRLCSNVVCVRVRVLCTLCFFYFHFLYVAVCGLLAGAICLCLLA